MTAVKMMRSLPTKKRIGLLGGSFDPVHTGHLVIAQDALERLELSEIIFIPASIPPHKQHLQQADAKHRLNMLKLALESDIRMNVSDIEIQRGGTSYTIDTLREIRDDDRDVDLFLIIGSDTLVEMHTWKDFDQLVNMCQVATLMRPGDDQLSDISSRIQQPSELKEQLLGNLIEAHKMEVSSTEIRMRVAEGLSIRYLVPSEVEMYIYEHGLYRG